MKSHVQPFRSCRLLATALLMVVCLSGCTQTSASCVAPEADVPSTVSAGTVLTLHVSNLWAECYDTNRVGVDKLTPLNTVEIEAFVAGNTDTIVATATASVDNDATSVVELFIPADTLGALVIRIPSSGQVLGTVSVSTP